MSFYVGGANLGVYVLVRHHQDLQNGTDHCAVEFIDV